MLQRRARPLALLCLLLALGLCAAVKDTKFYKALDIDPDADEATIKRAYKKQAMCATRVPLCLYLRLCKLWRARAGACIVDACACTRYPAAAGQTQSCAQEVAPRPQP